MVVMYGHTFAGEELKGGGYGEEGFEEFMFDIEDLLGRAFDGSSPLDLYQLCDSVAKCAQRHLRNMLSVDGVWSCLQELTQYIAVKLSVTVDTVFGCLVECARQDEFLLGMVTVLKQLQPTLVWHIPQGGEFETGYCYLAMFEEDLREDARKRLGAFPTLYQIAQLPRAWFSEAIYELEVITDDMDKPMPAMMACSVFTALRGVAHNARIIDEDSVVDQLWDVGTVDYVPLTVPLHDRIGGFNEWHITTDNEKYSSTLPDGYCYQHLFKYRHRRSLARELGPFPTARQLLTYPVSMFRDKKKLARVLILPRGDDKPVAFLARDTLIRVAHKTESFAEGTLGHMYKSRHPYPCIDDMNPPEPDDKVGGATPLRASEFSISRARNSEYVPPMNISTAETVFVRSMEMWGLPQEEHEDEMLTAMAAVLVSGSSNAVFENTTVKVAGGEQRLRVLVECLLDVCGAPNAVRLWVRSFRGGQICARISGVLDNEANVALRQLAASKYRTDMRYVHLCFDTVKTYSKIASLRVLERIFVRVSKALRFDTAEANAGVLQWLHPPIRSPIGGT